MFAFSDAFDDIFLEEVTKVPALKIKSEEIQSIIKESIVYPLRQ